MWAKRILLAVHDVEHTSTLPRKGTAEHGVTAIIRFLSKVFSGHPLKESSTRTWKKYKVELAKNKKAGKDMAVKELVEKKRGEEGGEERT